MRENKAGGDQKTEGKGKNMGASDEKSGQVKN